MFACDEPDVTETVGMFELICKLSQLKNEQCTVVLSVKNEHARAREEDLSLSLPTTIRIHTLLCRIYLY